jgi:hypothetical protein
MVGLNESFLSLYKANEITLLNVTIIISYSNLVNLLGSKIMLMFYQIEILSEYATISLIKPLTVIIIKDVLTR